MRVKKRFSRENFFFKPPPHPLLQILSIHLDVLFSRCAIVWKVIWYHETLSSILFTRKMPIHKKKEMYSNFVRCQLDLEKIRHDFCSLPYWDHSQIFSLRNESSCLKIFFLFSLLQHIDFLRYNFSQSYIFSCVFFFYCSASLLACLHASLGEGVNRDTWIYDDDVTCSFKVLAVKKWSGNFSIFS